MQTLGDAPPSVGHTGSDAAGAEMDDDYSIAAPSDLGSHAGDAAAAEGILRPFMEPFWMSEV